MSRTRVKICGITSVADALAVVEAGADAIGLVFYGPSPRSVSVATARAIARALPPLVTAVGVFVNPQAQTVCEVVDEVAPGLLQFHGTEPPAFCGSFGVDYMKAIGVGDDTDVVAEAAPYANAAALLLDTRHDTLWGGSGRVFDWRRVPESLGRPVFLAGGLSAANVVDAIDRVRPFAVDVSGGVEHAPGKKDPKRVAEFIREVCSVEVAEHQA